jgi:hypothetical protein
MLNSKSDKAISFCLMAMWVLIPVLFRIGNLSELYSVSPSCLFVYAVVFVLMGWDWFLHKPFILREYLWLLGLAGFLSGLSLAILWGICSLNFWDLWRKDVGFSLPQSMRLLRGATLGFVSIGIYSLTGVLRQLMIRAWTRISASRVKMGASC